MVNPDLIIRTNRRSMSITITREGELVIHAPKKLKLSEVYKYIAEKESWIKSKQNEIEQKLNINKDVIKYNDYLFLGKKYKITRVDGIKNIELSTTQIIVPKKITERELPVKIKKWYIQNAKKILLDRLEYFANIMQLDYASLTLSNSKNRWGSCDVNRNIKLNFRLIMLPHKAVDFVIIHELSHIVEFNHSKDFYKIIATIMPGYKLQQKILKENDYLLNLFR